jgi:hypothetical protein
MPRYSKAVLLCFALSVVIPLTVLAQQTSLGTFTTIDVPGASRSQARYINPRRDIVGFYAAGKQCMVPC